MREFKSNCWIDDYEAHAHIAEYEYDFSFTVWLGVVEIYCDEKTRQTIYGRVMNRPVVMRLEDGHGMMVYISSRDETNLTIAGGLGCNFVSLTTLFNKETTGQPHFKSFGKRNPFG